MQAFGWTWEYMDDCMTVPRVRSVYAGLVKKPPVHWLVAGFFGVGGSAADGQAQAAGDVRPSETFATFAGGGELLDG